MVGYNLAHYFPTKKKKRKKIVQCVQETKRKVLTKGAIYYFWICTN